MNDDFADASAYEDTVKAIARNYAETEGQEMMDMTAFSHQKSSKGKTQGKTGAGAKPLGGKKAGMYDLGGKSKGNSKGKKRF